MQRGHFLKTNTIQPIQEMLAEFTISVFSETTLGFRKAGNTLFLVVEKLGRYGSAARSDSF